MKKKNVYVPTKARGFLVNLFKESFDKIEFSWDQKKVYEINSYFKIWIAKLVKSKFANHLGLIQKVNVKKNNFDYAFSFNRFLKTSKNYIIYLENPTALFHYSLGRNKTLLGKREIKKNLKDPNLKSIVCLSKACYDTVGKFYNIPNTVKVEQIYPLIPENPLTTKETIEVKTYRHNIKCLYISSEFQLKGGEEIIECFKRLEEKGVNNVSLKIITRKSKMKNEYLKRIENLKNVEVFDFNYSKDELDVIYNNSNILLNPTRQDSFSLVVLEAIKAGNTILSTDLYAIPEMVKNNYNGYLIGPKYRFFGIDNMPNENVWDNRKNTIYSNYIDDKIVDFLIDKIKYLNENRNELMRLSINSYEKSNQGEFNHEYIKMKWSKVFSEL